MVLLALLAVGWMLSDRDRMRLARLMGAALLARSVLIHVEFGH